MRKYTSYRCARRNAMRAMGRLSEWQSLGFWHMANQIASNERKKRKAKYNDPALRASR